MFRQATAILIVLMGAGACASNPAQSSAVVPLQIPEPPPRVSMAPIPAAETPPPDRPAPPPVPAAIAAPAPTPALKPAPAAAAPPAASPEPARPSPVPELRPAVEAGHGPTAPQVLDLLNRTKQKLDAINRNGLNAGKRADYDSARRFLVQAEAAVKENNLMLAESSAAKAETLADGLR